VTGPATGPATGTDADTFREAAGRFATGIVVVSASLDGVDHAMTVNAFTSVSLDPLLVLFCAEKAARFHGAVLAAGAWAVSVLGEDAEETSRWLSTRGRPLEGQLADHPHHPGPRTGAPILDNAIASIECRTRDVYDGGDHSIVVGEVMSVKSHRPDVGPLIYYKRKYRRLDGR
jgi:flavin reductase (DIM6/NTAB) family NADH-FMN oxidoreductase RutF